MRSSPLRIQENLHVVLWLIKDLSWLMEYRMLGLLMVAPTITVAGIIAWKSRHIRVELLHAMAVILWISANSTWMIEDLFLDGRGHVIAQALFLSGLLILAVHYLILLPLELRRVRHGTRDRA